MSDKEVIMDVAWTINRVLEKVQKEFDKSFEVEASGQHIHLSQEGLDTLFGKSYQLTKAKVFDENNACSFTKGMRSYIVKK